MTGMTGRQAYALTHPLTNPDDIFAEMRHLGASEQVRGIGLLQSILAVDR